MSADPELSELPPTFRSALRSRQLRRLLVTLFAGSTSQQVLTLAVGVWVLDRTGSGLWVSVAVSLTYVPYALLSGFAGVLVDRYSRSSVLALSSAVRAACAAGLLAVVAGDGPPWAVIAVAAVAATPGYPATAAATPECVSSSALPAANALVTGVENVAWLAGPGVFGLLLLTGDGPVFALVVAGVLFGVGALAGALVALPRPVRAADDGDDGRLRDVLRLAAGDPRVRLPLLAGLLSNLGVGYLVVALVLLPSGTSVAWRGGLNAALTVGALAGMLVVNRLAECRRPMPVIGLSLATFGLAMGLLGVAGAGVAGLALVGLAGAASVVAEVIMVTMLQRATPESAHGRVLGLFDQVAVGSIALGSLAVGPAADAIGPGPATAVAGWLGVALVVAAPLAGLLHASFTKRFPRRSAVATTRPCTGSRLTR